MPTIQELLQTQPPVEAQQPAPEDQTTLNFANSLQQAQPAPQPPTINGVPTTLLPNEAVAQQPVDTAPPPTSQSAAADQYVESPLQQKSSPENILDQSVEAQSASDKLQADKLDKTFDMQKKAAAAIGDYQAKKLGAEANQRDIIDTQMAERQAKVQQLSADVGKNVDDELKTLDSYRQKIAEMPIDAPQIRDNSPFHGSTSQKIMAGIAIALGGIGGAFTGKGDNKALDVINNAIDRDIQMQKENAHLTQETQGRKMQQLKAGADLSQNMLSALNVKFDNQMQGEAATRALMLESAKNKLDKVSAKYGAPEVQAKAQMLSAQIEQEQVKELYKFKSAAETKQILIAIGKKMNEPGAPILNPGELAMLPDDMRKAYMEQLDRTVPGFGQAINKNAAQEFSKFVAETGPALTNAKQVYDLGKKLTTAQSLEPKKRAEIESRLAILAGQLRLPITGPGALTSDEYKRLRDTIGDPKAILGLRPVELKKLDTVIKYLQSTINERAQQAGLRKADVNNAIGFKPIK